MSESTSSDAVVELVRLAKGRKFEAFETALTQYLEGPNPSPGVLAEAFIAFGKSKDVLDDVEPLLWMTANVLDESHGPSAAMAAVDRLAAVLPESATLREEARRLVEKLHADFPGVAGLAEHTIERDGVGLDEALRELHHLLAFVPGTFVYEKTKARVGRLEAFDPEREMFKVGYGDTHEFYKPASLEKLVVLDRDDFRGLALFEADRLRQMLQDEPVRVVELLLKSARDDEMKFRDVKAAIDPFLPEKGWSKWWKAVKPKLRHSPILELGDGTQPLFRRRAKPLSAEEQLRRELVEIDSPLERLALMLSRSREWEPGSEHDTPLAARCESTLDETESALPPEAADIHLVLRGVRQELTERFPETVKAPGAPEDAWIDAVIDKPEGFLKGCADDTLEQAALAYLVTHSPGRVDDVLVALLPYSTGATCEWIARALSDRGHAARMAEAFAVMHRRPTQCIDALVWAWKSTDAGRYGELLAESSTEELLLTLLSLAARLGRGAATKTNRQHPKLPAIRSALAARDFELVEQVVKDASQEEAGHINDVIRNNLGLAGGTDASIRHILQRRHPELFREDVPPWEDGAIYTTATGLEKRKADLQHLIKEKIPANQKKLSHARAFGDLSENAEYDAAKEEAGQLAEQAERMQSELNRAQVIHSPLQEDKEVSIGTTVKARRTDSGEVETYTFLGPWDADHDNHVYSYEAPLSLEFMGKKVGDTVAYGEGRDRREWTIVGVEGAL